MPLARAFHKPIAVEESMTTSPAGVKPGPSLQMPINIQDCLAGRRTRWGVPGGVTLVELSARASCSLAGSGRCVLTEMTGGD
jgi:hypothetical protein